MNLKVAAAAPAAAAGIAFQAVQRDPILFALFMYPLCVEEAQECMVSRFSYLCTYLQKNKLTTSPVYSLAQKIWESVVCLKLLFWTVVQ